MKPTKKPAKAPKPVKAWAAFTRSGELFMWVDDRYAIYKTRKAARFNAGSAVRVEIRVLGGKK